MATEDLLSELHGLRDDLARLLDKPVDDLIDAAKSHASVATEQIKTALGDLSETLADEEDHIAKLTAERPLAALASAFAAGLIVGLLLRRTH